MAHLTPDRSQVNARIVFWGIAGAGVSSNLHVIHQKLRADHRGELLAVPTRLDPTTAYEVLPIELGQVNGLRTQLQIVGIPGGPEHAPTRKQLLDQVDGIVFVADSRAERQEENLDSLLELRDALEAYGRDLNDIPVVVQYNKRDISDPYVIEELHRKLDLPHAAVFEAISSGGKGVLQTLTTISKQVVRMLRDADLEAREEQPLDVLPEPLGAELDEIDEEVAPEPAAPEPLAARSAVDLMEQAILAEGGAEDPELAAESLSDLNLEIDPHVASEPWDAPAPDEKSAEGLRIGPDLEIVSAGQARLAGQRTIEIPLVLGNRDGETVTLRLSVSLDPLLDPLPDGDE